MIGLGLAASGHFPYAANYAGSIAVANFNFSILMRNEVFGRFLYLFFNTLFAKVCYPPPSFAQSMRIDQKNCFYSTVATSLVPSGNHVCASTPGGYSQRLCTLGHCLAYV